MEGPPGSRDGEAQPGQLAGGPDGGYEVEEICFELLLAGVPEEIIWGYHNGWPWDRLLRLYLFLRRNQILEQESGTLQVAIGAGALFNKRVLGNFQNKTRSAIKALDNRRGDFGLSKEAKAQKDIEQFQKLFGSLGAPIKIRKPSND